MEENKRICRKCLIREMEGRKKLYETLQRYIDDIEPAERTKEELYNQRLSTCKECQRFLEGMCRACGCYVELRAATNKNTCPYGQW